MSNRPVRQDPVAEAGGGGAAERDFGRRGMGIVVSRRVPRPSLARFRRSIGGGLPSRGTRCLVVVDDDRGFGGLAIDSVLA